MAKNVLHMSTNKPMSLLIFEKYDADKSGKIDHNEFRKLCYSMGHFLDDKSLDIALHTIGGSEITYPQFMAWWRNNDDRFKRLEAALEKPALRNAIDYFQYFDKDHSGSIDKEEFRTLHADLVKHKFTQMTYAQALKKLDANGDGDVSFNEYLDWLQEIGSVVF